MDRRRFLGSVAASTAWAVWQPPLAQAGILGEKLRWHKDLREAHTLAVESNRPLLIVFSATWCTYCHKLMHEVGADAKASKYISTNFVPTVLDFDKDARIAKVFEVESLPTTVVLTPQADLLLTKAGYLKPEPYRKLLEETLARRAEVQQVKADQSP